ncbi:MAG: hypothetical protein WCI75_11720 [candidate division NC10 bacterium]
MPRHARLDAPDTIHHVRVRGRERCVIFTDDTDREDCVPHYKRCRGHGDATSEASLFGGFI